MRLSPPPPGLPALRQRLSDRDEAPVAVAYSGGGDSHALLLAADAWARETGRRLVVLHVDHHIQSASGGWAQACAAVAARLGLPFRRLDWTGEKPATGLAAAARRARHTLLADAARAAGARVILLGHTADDVAEARLMRAQGATTPNPQPWSPSPAWPEGRGVFLLRPLIEASRASLRDWLRAQGETWIDDPANDDLTRGRARARAALAAGVPPPLAPAARDAQALARLAALADFPIGQIAWARDAFAAAAPEARRAALAAACLCTAGTLRPPRSEALARLDERLAAGGDVAATLAGARIEASGGFVRILREPGEVRRGGLSPLALPAGETGVWDGRWELTAPAGEALRIEPLRGLAAGLAPQARRRLGELPPPVRWGLPAIRRGQDVACPPLAPAPGLGCRALAPARFAAACGLIGDETAAAAWER